jgi:hypothetical protein
MVLVDKNHAIVGAELKGPNTFVKPAMQNNWILVRELTKHATKAVQYDILLSSFLRMHSVLNVEHLPLI